MGINNHTNGTQLTGSRFGNYIGEPADSDEEHQDEELKPQAFAFDEAFGEEEDESQNADQLMEIDGVS
jgi:U5 small nuclear ribonucleoprotein component